MRVAVYYSNNDVRLEQRPVPEVGPGELLMRVRCHPGVVVVVQMLMLMLPPGPFLDGQMLKMRSRNSSLMVHRMTVSPSTWCHIRYLNPLVLHRR